MKSNFSFYVFVGLLLFSTLVEAQWVKQTNGLPDNWNLGWAIDASDSNNAIITMGLPTGTGIFKTTDGGDLWFQVQLPDTINEPVIDISMPSPSYIWAATDLGKIIASTDGGQSWDIQFDDTSKTEFMNYVEMFDNSNGVAMGDVLSGSPSYNPGPALFLRTTDGGIKWISVNDSAFGGYSGDTWRRLDFVDPTHGYFYESGINPQKLYKTNDGCTNWYETNYSGRITVLKCFNENIVVAHSIYDTKISRTTDGGTNWNATAFSGDWGNDFEFIPGDASNVFFTDYENLFFSNDTGKTWKKLIVDMTELKGRDIVFTDENNGWILCDSGKVYKTITGGIPTDVDEIDISVPAQFSLSQNYPNPFNPVTTIKYTISSKQLVQLKVYDILGREIATLVNEEQPAGIYNVQFTMNNLQLSSGIYFYQLKAGNFVETMKMILLK